MPDFLNRPVKVGSLLLSLIPLAFFMMACQSQPNQVFIDVDGRRETLTTEAKTVREALAEANIVLEPLDKVNPDLYVQLESGLEIEVTRVTEEIETEREIVPFERQVVTNEALNPGETKLAQLGLNGEDEITIRVVYENGQEVSRTETSREIVIAPQPEILIVGPQGELPAISIEGTIAYLSNGNAWLIRDTSSSRRPLTTAGDLDGRVFALSPDGRQLVYTRQISDDLESPLNELWLVSTTIINEPPQTLNIQGVLSAEWSPVISQSRLVYSTAERAPNPPGWQANNDLWLLNLPYDSGEAVVEPVELLAANTQGLYPWWGMNFTWSPDGRRLAYARADQIGVIDVAIAPTSSLSDSLTALVDFAPLQTLSDWVWAPQMSWSPDGRFLATTVHGPPLTTETPEDSQVFDLWLLNVDGAFSAKVAGQVGMWANPQWGESGIAFGQAINPLESATSRYTLQLIDRDGSNKRQLFPILNDTGVELPEMTWSPDGRSLLFVYNGDLYLSSSPGSPPRQVTTDSQVSQLQWAAHLTSTTLITVTPALTATATTRPTPGARGTPIQTTPQPPIRRTPTPSQATTTSTPFDIEQELKGGN